MGKKVSVKKVSVQGVEVSISEDALDDFELLEDLAAMQDGDGSRLPAVFRRLTGEDYKRILEELRGDNGRVSVTAATEFITELFKAVAPNA